MIEHTPDWPPPPTTPIPAPGAAPSRTYTPMAALDLSQHGGTWMLDERAESVAKAALTGAWRQAREAYPDVETWGPCAPHIRVTVEFVPAHHTCRHCGQQIAGDGDAPDMDLMHRYVDMVADRDQLWRDRQALRVEITTLAGQLAEAQAAAVRAGKRNGAE